MDEKSPPENTQTTEIVKEPAMATLVAAIPAPPVMLDAPPPNNTANAAGSGVNKRYRPAPAKTFQCRGYGDCRMVFSRSEHLARHIRKHTGERPFSCHCGKQFSRLDNLRQHAQTVHADKQELNDKMMRELTSLHASMSAATKGGPVRGKRGSAGSAGPNPTTSSPTSSASPTEGESSTSVKQEDVPPAIPTMSQHPRPGTSTGYEGDNGIIYQHIPGSSAWHPQNPSPIANNPRPTSNYSFRDSLNAFGQSFRTSPTTTYPYFGQYSSGQSFLGSPKSRDSRIEPNRTTSDARSLPSINAVVSSSLASPSQQSQPPHCSYIISQPPPPTAAGAHILPLPTPTALRRPATSASRPTTAPASYCYSPPGNGSAYGRQLPFHGSHGIRLGFTGAELSIPVYGGGKLGGGFGIGDFGPTSPTIGESPFSFHPPALVAESSVNPRKRPFPGSDDDSVSAGNATEYDYGTESRPQSRRLSVMELCNDTDIPATPPRTATGDSRPGSRAVLQSISAALDDRPRTSPSSALFSADKTAARGADASSIQTQAVRRQSGNGNGLSPEVAGRRILEACGDGKRVATRPSSNSPVLTSTRSPLQESTIPPPRSTTSSFGFTSGVARSSASGTERESPGNDKVRLSTGFAPVRMKA